MRRSATSCHARIERLEDRLQFAAGALNTAFVGTGILKKLYKTTNDFIDAVIQKDGKIVCVGQSQTSGKTKDALVARFNADGSPDTTFGSGGIANLGFTTTSDDIASSVAIDPLTKRIVVAGVTGKGAATDMFIARYTTRGKLDTTFNLTGKLTLDFNSRTDAAVDVLVDINNEIIVSGFTGSTSSITGGMFIAMARLLNDGTGDPNFGTNGRFTGSANLGGALEFGAGMARQSDGKYVVATTRIIPSLSGFSSYIGVSRINDDGTFDNSYGGFGRSFGPLKTNTVQIASSVALDPVTGNAVVAGTVANGSFEFATGTATVPTFSFIPIGVATTADWQILRYKASDGSLDTSFSGDGIQPLNFKTNSKSRLDGATTISVDSKSRIYVAGASQLSGQVPDFAAARLTSSGRLDATFDGDGLAIYNIGGSDGAFGSVRGSGQIFLVGHSKNNGGKNYAILASVLI